MASLVQEQSIVKTSTVRHSETEPVPYFSKFRCSNLDIACIKSVSTSPTRIYRYPQGNYQYNSTTRSSASKTLISQLISMFRIAQTSLQLIGIPFSCPTFLPYSHIPFFLTPSIPFSISCVPLLNIRVQDYNLDRFYQRRKYLAMPRKL